MQERKGIWTGKGQGFTPMAWVRVIRRRLQSIAKYWARATLSALPARRPGLLLLLQPLQQKEKERMNGECHHAAGACGGWRGGVWQRRGLATQRPLRARAGGRCGRVARAAGAAQRSACIAGACAAGVDGASGPGVARGRAVLVGAARRVKCVWVGRMDGARFSGRASFAILPD
jgi:hypothetical protein